MYYFNLLHMHLLINDKLYACFAHSLLHLTYVGDCMSYGRDCSDNNLNHAFL
jgi:hypothetical protein